MRTIVGVLLFAIAATVFADQPPADEYETWLVRVSEAGHQCVSHPRAAAGHGRSCLRHDIDGQRPAVLSRARRCLTGPAAAAYD